MHETYSGSAYPTYSSFSLKSFVTVLCRRKGLVIANFIGLFVSIALITLLTPKQYESHMKVLVKNERIHLVVSPDPRNGAQIPTEVSENDVNSEIELLTSNDILARVVRECTLYAGDPSAVQAAGAPSPV